MPLTGSFLLGFISAVVGTALPGLINMTAVKVNLKEGKKTALWFIVGAVSIIFFQTFIALLFAKQIDRSPSLIIYLRELGGVIFFLLTIYFLFLAKTPKLKEGNIKKYSKSSRFFLGILLSVLNFFPIPYYIVLGITFSSYRLFTFENSSISLFVSGVVLGAFAIFYAYVEFFNSIQSKADFMMQNMNKIIGSITGLISVITLWNILNHYFFHWY